MTFIDVYSAKKCLKYCHSNLHLDVELIPVANFIMPKLVNKLNVCIKNNVFTTT